MTQWVKSPCAPGKSDNLGDPWKVEGETDPKKMSSDPHMCVPSHTYTQDHNKLKIHFHFKSHKTPDFRWLKKEEEIKSKFKKIAAMEVVQGLKSHDLS